MLRFLLAAVLFEIDKSLLFLSAQRIKFISLLIVFISVFVAVSRLLAPQFLVSCAGRLFVKAVDLTVNPSRAAAAVCMGLAVTAAMQWIAIGTLPGVLEWARDYPGHLAMTALLWAVPVAVLGTLTGRLWIAALPVGAAGLILALVDYFKNTINGTPLELADFGLAGAAGNVAGLAGDLTPPGDFYLAAQDFRIGIPGMLLQIFGGYALLKAIAKR